jgi:Tfp pilus assembly protein PilN
MIRINLVPQKRKRSAGGPAPTRAARAESTGGGGSGAATAVLMLLGWGALAGAGWYLLSIEDEAGLAVRANAAGISKEVNAIRAVIDEAGQKARREEIKRQEIAIEKLKSKQRTPAFVMYELAMILTDPAQGGGVTKDEEKYNRNKAADPQSVINERWDPSGLWLTSIKEEAGRLTIEGAARDAADLSEFTRRLRASVWFGEITHPDYERVNDTRPDQDAQRHLTWKLDVEVRRWN